MRTSPTCSDPRIPARRTPRGRPASALALPALLTAIAIGVASLPARAMALPGEAPAAARPETRTFRIVHRSLDDAYRLISPLLSDAADVRVQRASRTIEVSDAAERLAAAAAALAAFDVEPWRVRVAVRLVKGEKRDVPEPVSEAGRGVPKDVRELLPYNAFETVGAVELVVREGQTAAGILAGDDRFRVEVGLGTVDKSGGSIEVKLLSLTKRRTGSDGKPAWGPVFQFSEELTSGKGRVHFATASSADRNAVFLLVTGTIE